MPIESTRIYSLDTKGALRFWAYEVDGDKWRGHSGLVDGKITTSGWTTSKPKNVGKKNATTAEEQAMAEAEAEFRKKLGREYRRTPDDLADVPPAPMLAQKYKDLKGHLYFPGGVEPRVFSQPKLDGIRMLASIRGGTSRDYQPFGASVQHILDALAPVFESDPDLIFDGELYNHQFKDDFNTISSLVRKEKLAEADRLRCHQYLQYHVYDLPDAGAQFLDRYMRLNGISAEFQLDLSPIVVVDTHGCRSLEELDLHYDRYLAQGYEGQMIRTDEPYEFGVRSWSLLKRKTFVDIEVPVVRLINGDGNWDCIPKSIEYMLPGDKRGEDGNRPKASIKGSQVFCRSLVDREPKFATIRYFALTPAGVPRFPVAVDFHDTERKD